MAAFITECSVSLDGIDYSTHILESRFPSIVITRKVIDSEADLVTLGTHGMSGFASHFIGSNAERLVNESPVSVLAVRD
jgi:nucleotide-binding universal stress UspA family protein